MKSWFSGLARTRDKIIGGLQRLIPALAKADPAALEAWERALIEADVAPRLAAQWIEQVRRTAGHGDLRVEVEKLLLAALPAPRPFSWERSEKPLVVLITGVNGSGKTTTTAKLGHVARNARLKPLLAAADTFRAAGSHQLKLWAERLELDVVAGAHGADAAAVAFDAVSAARARRSDVVLIDTAGRMHTKQPLMEELQKVRRSVAKAMPGAPHECWIVLDATLGNNAVVQARSFKDCVQLTGAIVAKLDGSSKAGFVFSIQQELGIPIRFIGLGESADDLAAFDAHEFVHGLMAEKE